MDRFHQFFVISIRLFPLQIIADFSISLVFHKYSTMERHNKHGINDKEIFKNHEDYWQVADNIKNIYMSDGSLATLLDFERVLDELDLYAFKNWDIGELVQGPTIGKYRVTAIFMWPANLMPDPRGGRRLLPFDCEVIYKKQKIKIPIKIKDPSDYRPGTQKAKLIERDVWLVEITMPKSLMNDIRTGSIELEGEEISLDELDRAYEQDLDKEEIQNDERAENAQQNLKQDLQPVPAV